MASNDATPARVTRARSKTPLPAINPKASHAYGAQGKTNLRSQVRSSAGNFTQEFQSSRKAMVEPSMAEDDESVAQPSSPEMRETRAPRRGRPPSKGSISEENVEELKRIAARSEAPLPERSATALDAEAEYVRATREREQEIRPHVREPSRLRVFINTLPRYVPRLIRSANPGLKDLSLILSVLSTVVLLLNIWCWTPLPSSVAPYRDEFFKGLKVSVGIRPYDQPPTAVEERWHRFKHDLIFSSALPSHNMPDMQWALNINFLNRLEKVEAKMTNLAGDMSLQSETMEALQRMLPSEVVVHLVDGKYEIPEAFWQALQERLAGDTDVTPLWHEYLQRNERQLETLSRQMVDEQLTTAMEEKQIITREAFVEAIKENNDWLASRYKEDYQKIWAANFKNLKAAAISAATDVMEASPGSAFAKDQLDNLVKANEIHNAYEALRTINWFSAGLGARIDPKLSSPTQNKPARRSWFPQDHLAQWAPLLMKPHAPIVALKRWDEATDCWCASTAEKDYTQITVQTIKKIFPERLVIEHVPASGTLDIAAAPKEFEIWAETHSKDEAERVWEAMYDVVPFHHTHQCSSPPSSRHVCIGQGYYDIHQHNYVQTTRVWPPMEQMAFGVDKFTIKINENWGANHTCLYRLRMTGKQAVAS